MRRDNGLLRTIAVYAPLTLQQEYYLLLVVASSESRLCAQFVPSPVKRRKRLQLQEFHRRKRLVCLEQRQLHIHWFDAFWAHASEVPMHEWTGSNWSWTWRLRFTVNLSLRSKLSLRSTKWNWNWNQYKTKSACSNTMTSVVGDTIGRLQNVLQKFLDYSYRYSLFNSYSFRGNYRYIDIGILHRRP